MIGKELIIYSLKNLWARKTRSFLTIFSILIGIATIFLFISFGLGLYTYINDLTTGSSADKLLIQPKGGTVPGLDDSFAFNDKELEVIEKTPGVKDVSGAIMKVVEIRQDKTKKFVFAMGYDPDKPLLMELMDIDIAKGRNLKSGDNGKILLGYNYQIENKIFPEALEVGDKLEVQGKELKVVGFLDSVGNPQDDSQIYLDENAMQELYPNEDLKYGWVIARVDINNMDQISEEVEENLRDSRNQEKGKEDFSVQSFDSLIESFSSALNIVIGFVILIALISVVVSAVNTANTMVTSVLERIREIGIMKAIGAKNSEIFNIFLFESAFLGFVAGVMGVILGWLLALTAGNILSALGWGFLSPYYPWQLFLGCIAFATVTGAVSGAFPAYRASKTIVVEALRYE